MNLNTSLKSRLRNNNLSKPHSTINKHPDLSMGINGFINETKVLIEKKIGGSNKIDELQEKNKMASENYNADVSSDSLKLEKFFGEGKIPKLLTDRINNEYSHLCGEFERGATPVDVTEMKTAANLIIEKLKEDEDQFEALLNSIGEEILEDEGTN